MSKVLVDPAALEEAAKWLEIHSSSSGSAEAFAADALREAIAQPAEAEGVDFGFDDRSVKVSQEAYSIFLARERHHLAALSAVTAERDRLRKDAERYRWLREMHQSPCGLTLTIARVGMMELTGWSGDDPDSVIDAAMAAKEA